MTLIKNAQIIDGTGRPPYQADVLIAKDRISAIGNFASYQAAKIIDGQGCYLTPGFIDVNASSDHYLTLFTNPAQSSFVLQGVTTIIGGNCGSSLAPLLYGSLESIRKWAGDANQINVSWHSVQEFFTVLKRRGLGVNFGTLIGHSTIRRALIGDTTRDLTVGELKVFKKILSDALDQGALGLSTGLNYIHSKAAPFYELKALAEVVAKHHGVYVTHPRDEKDQLVNSIGETIKLTQETKVKTLVSHFRPLMGFEKNFHAGLELLDKASDDLNIHFDSYISEFILVPLYTLLPDWLQTGNLELMVQEIADPDNGEKIIKAWPNNFKPNDIIIAYAPHEHFLVGKSLGQFAKNRNLKLRPALLELMRATKLRVSVFYKNVNMDLAIQNLANNKALIASNAPGTTEDALLAQHERITNTFPKFLELVQNLKLMSLEQAVRKITAVPAKKFNLADRGEIKLEKIADLNLIKDGRIKSVFINGQLRVKDGLAQNILPGRVVKTSS